MAIADLNGDVNLDLAVANDGSDNATILLGDGAGGFRQATGSPFPAGENPGRMAIADFNNDGVPDMAFANHEMMYVTILLGDGGGGFSPAPDSPFTVATDPHVHAVAAGDYNGDGSVDLVVESRFGNSVAVLWGNGRGGFETPGTSFTVGLDPYRVAASDVDGDGNLDILTSNVGGLTRDGRNDDVTVLLGDGRGRFAQAAGSPFPVGSDPFGLAAGDITGDGGVDLAIPNFGSDDVTILLGDGRGGFVQAPGSPFPAGSRPAGIAMGDVNGDGNLDVAVANWGSNDVTLLLGNEGGVRIAPGSPFDVGTNPYGIAMGDLNGDGKADIVTANHGSNDITILFSR